jgi:hypothetical protein
VLFTGVQSSWGHAQFFAVCSESSTYLLPSFILKSWIHCSCTLPLSYLQLIYFKTCVLGLPHVCSDSYSITTACDCIAVDMWLGGEKKADFARGTVVWCTISERPDARKGNVSCELACSPLVVFASGLWPAWEGKKLRAMRENKPVGFGISNIYCCATRLLIGNSLSCLALHNFPS